MKLYLIDEKSPNCLRSANYFIYSACTVDITYSYNIRSRKVDNKQQYSMHYYKINLQESFFLQILENVREN